MRKLRWLIITLVVFLTIFLNIERLDFGRPNLINIDSFVYVIGVAGVLIILSISFVNRLPSYIPYTIMFLFYLVLKLYVFNLHPIMGGIATYVTVTEITFLTILIYLSITLSKILINFETTVEKLLFPEKNPHVLEMEEASSRVTQEINKCRRHKRPLSILLIQPTVDSTQEQFNHLIEGVKLAISNRLLSSDFSSIIANLLRRSDYLIEQPKLNRFIILCPEANNNLLPVLQDRVNLIIQQKLEGVSVRYGQASFPHDALTFEELLIKAESELNKGLKNNSTSKGDDLLSNQI